MTDELGGYGIGEHDYAAESSSAAASTPSEHSSYSSSKSAGGTGPVVNSYKLLREIGAGTHGTVYLAMDAKSGEQVVRAQFNVSNMSESADPEVSRQLRRSDVTILQLTGGGC